MKSFEYAAPKTLKEAAALLGEKWGETEILAGGTDLITSLKQHITEPKRVVSLKGISEIRGIRKEGKGLHIGAMTTLEELVSNADVRQNFPALVTAARNIGSAQILSMGTVGGDLCQRPRCWYFRNGLGLLAKKDGKSLVREGDNRYHAIFNTEGDALFVSASSLAPVIIALGGQIAVQGPKGNARHVKAAEFFRPPRSEQERETILKPNEIVAGVSVPFNGLKNALYEVRHRHGLDWPYVAAAVAFAEKNGAVSDARVVLGHVAATPWAAASAARALNGARVDESAAAKAGEAAIEGAKPLSRNEYKVQMVKTAVKRAALAAQAA